MISFQVGRWSSRAVCTVSRSCSPALLQRTGADVGAGVDLAQDAFEDFGARLGSAQALPSAMKWLPPPSGLKW
jgi:hypothetical protein